MNHHNDLFGIFTPSNFDARAFRNATNATWAIIGLNSAVFAAWQYAQRPEQWQLNRRLAKHFMLSWDGIKAGHHYTMITSAFSHQGLKHFAFNMYSLYTLGSELAWCPAIGGAGMVALAAGSGIMGSFAWLYDRKMKDEARSRRRTFGSVGYQALGASGIVSGMSAVATFLNPNASVRMDYLPFDLPQWLASAAYFLVDVYGMNDEWSHIGHSAVSIII